MSVVEVDDFATPPAEPRPSAQHHANAARTPRRPIRERILDWLTRNLIGDEPVSDLNVSHPDALDGIGRRDPGVPPWQI